MPMTLAFGALLWADWPVSRYWFLGLALAISLLLRGWSYVMMAIAQRSLPGPMETRDTDFLELLSQSLAMSTLPREA
jgi:hypothetical protein